MINSIKNINTISGMDMDKKEKGRIILLKSMSTFFFFPPSCSCCERLCCLLPMTWESLLRTRLNDRRKICGYHVRSLPLAVARDPSIGSLALADKQLSTDPNIESTLNSRFPRVSIPSFLPRLTFLILDINIPTFIRSFFPRITWSNGSGEIDTLPFSLYESFRSC